VLWLSDGVSPDLVTSITTGLGANVAVTYKPMTDSTVYTKDSTTPGSLVDVVDLQGAMALVAKVDANNGVGGTVSTGYAYAGAKADLNGRGFLGFRQTTVTDLQTNLVATTSYRQDYPYTSLVADETKKLGAVTLNSTAHAYGVTGLGGTRSQAFLAQSQVQSADLDGTVLPTVTSAYQYDAYGNASQIVVSATDGFSKTTTNTYANDTAKWLLGRLTRAAVASALTTPGAPPAQPPTDTQVTIYFSTNSFNLWDYLVANGLAKAGTPGSWTVTIASGVTIGSIVPDNQAPGPALDTGVFPAGSTLKIINNGTVAGGGGRGGNGGSCGFSPPATSGVAGAAALRVQAPVTLVNNGKIWGGGGGGGGGWSPDGTAGGGGGGAGTPPAGGGQGAPSTCGDGGCTPSFPGSAGTQSVGGAGGNSGNGDSGGNGGGPGLAGSAGAAVSCGPPGSGGAAGPAAIGNSFITWSVVGDRKGPLN
jgi:hypothetical protein